MRTVLNGGKPNDFNCTDVKLFYGQFVQILPTEKFTSVT